MPPGRFRATLPWPQLRLVVALSAGPVLAQGLSRFAYALLLPTMRSDLHWSFATAGAMNTANALGYLLGSLAATFLMRAIGVRSCFRHGSLAIIVSLALTATTDDTVLLLLLRTVNGTLSAIVFVAGAAIVAHLGSQTSRSGTLLIAVYLGGVGTGIFLSGVVVPMLLAAFPDQDVAWRVGWLALAAIGVLMIPILWNAVEAARVVVPGDVDNRSPQFPVLRLLPFTISYCVFGVGYIGYMTFIVVLLREEFDAQPLTITAFWMLLGAMGIIGTLAWSPVVARLSPGLGAAILTLVTALSVGLPLVLPILISTFVSGALFGGTFLAVITAITAGVQRIVQPEYWTQALGVLTIGFAVGQCAGPLVAGLASDAGPGVIAGLGLSAGVLLVAAVAGIAQRSMPG